MDDFRFGALVGHIQALPKSEHKQAIKMTVLDMQIELDELREYKKQREWEDDMKKKDPFYEGKIIEEEMEM